MHRVVATIVLVLLPCPAVWAATPTEAIRQVFTQADRILTDPETDGRWKIRDVVVDGVSVAANYRAQIERVLEGASVSELLGQMRERAGRAEPPPRVTASTEITPAAAAVAAVDTSTPVLAAVVE